jgi:hypothetical protein
LRSGWTFFGVTAGSVFSLERSGREKSYPEGKVEENRGTVDFFLANLGQKFSSIRK